MMRSTSRRRKRRLQREAGSSSSLGRLRRRSRLSFLEKVGLEAALTGIKNKQSRVNNQQHNLQGPSLERGLVAKSEITVRRWWRDSDSNRGRLPLQGSALPTELSRSRCSPIIIIRLRWGNS